jgi:hypothetical protein
MSHGRSTLKSCQIKTPHAYHNSDCRKNHIINGIDLILRYEPSTQIRQRDELLNNQLYFGSFSGQQMTDSIIVNIDPTNESTIGILKGIALILKYEPSAKFSAEHDTLFFAAYSISEQMTEEELKLMDDWGWFKGYDSAGRSMYSIDLYQSVYPWPKKSLS